MNYNKRRKLTLRSMLIQSIDTELLPTWWTSVESDLFSEYQLANKLDLARLKEVINHEKDTCPLHGLRLLIRALWRMISRNYLKTISSRQDLKWAYLLQQSLRDGRCKFGISAWNKGSAYEFPQFARRIARFVAGNLGQWQLIDSAAIW